MLLLRTVLAVAHCGLLVSAVPGGARNVENVELTDDFSDNHRYPHDLDVASLDDDYDSQWTPGREGYGQFVMDDAQVSYNTEANGKGPGKQVPFPDIPHPGTPGHDFPKPPHKWPTPPQHPPEPPSRPPIPPHHPSGPHHPPPGAPPALNMTIYQTLESSPRFSRIFKLVNYTEDITKILNDSSSNVTFFALPNWAFPKPARRPPHRGEDRPSSFDESALLEEDSIDVLTTVEGLIHNSNKPDEDTIKKLLKYILSYQILPSQLSTTELGKNLTHATSLALSDGSLDGEPLRVRVAGQSVGGLFVNVNARIVRPNIPATNGLIHVVNHPVLPPPSIFQTSFILPQVFSTLTSALQRVELTDALEWSDIKGPVSGSPAVTFFAPTNKAFARLPRRLRMFLFSPFGEKALKKLLQFHVVPEFILHSNYLHNASFSSVQPEEHDSQSSLLHNSIDYSEYDLTLGIPADYVKPLAWVEADTVGTPDGTRRSHGCFHIDHAPPLHHPPGGPRGGPPHHPVPDYRLEHHPHYSPPCPPLSPLPCLVEHAPHRPFPPHGPEHGHHAPPSPPPHFPPWEPRERPPHSPFPAQGNEHDRRPPPPPPHFPPEEYHDGLPHHRFPGQAPEHGPHHPPPPPHKCESKRPRPFPRPHIVYSQNMTTPTLLGNHSLHVHVVQLEHRLPLPKPIPKHSSYQTVVLVHGVKVVLSDVPMRNGVIHVIDRLLNPLKKPSGPHRPHHPPPHGGEEPEMGPLVFEEEEDEWAGWEEWLPAWANEE